jgi:hypothetical protein
VCDQYETMSALLTRPTTKTPLAHHQIDAVAWADAVVATMAKPKALLSAIHHARIHSGAGVAADG